MISSKNHLYEVRRENLSRLVSKFGSLKALAESCGRPSSQISDLVSGRRNIGDKLALSIEASLNLNPEALSADFSQKLEKLPVSVFKTRQIPVISYVQAGMLNFSDCLFDEWLPVGNNVPNNAYALVVHGDSMLPDFHEGDYIIVDPDKSPYPGAFVVARSVSGFLNECTFKQYFVTGLTKHGQEKFELRPLNPAYPTLDSDEYGLEVVGVVIQYNKMF